MPYRLICTSESVFSRQTRKIIVLGQVEAPPSYLRCVSVAPPKQLLYCSVECPPNLHRISTECPSFWWTFDGGSMEMWWRKYGGRTKHLRRNDGHTTEERRSYTIHARCILLLLKQQDERMQREEKDHECTIARKMFCFLKKKCLILPYEREKSRIRLFVRNMYP